MGHYLINLMVTTVGVVSLLYLVFLYIKQNPALTGMLNKATRPQNDLTILSAMNLEPRKRLYVVGYKSQRFLLSTTMDKTDFLTTLEVDAPDLSLVTTADLTAAETPTQLSPNATVSDRFRTSLGMIIRDRFAQTEGK